MLPFLRKISLEQYSFFFIGLIGVILFSYNVHIAPLTADELSAIYRSNYDSLVKVFKNSIADDVHPPLIQIFLYFWLKLVGNNEILIKLPFLLMGICSIPLLFKLTKTWFNKNVALLTTAFFVSIQFVIMYNQIARPYISGLFFCLLVALQWTKIIENKAKSSNYILYLLFGILCAYNHYFGTLQIAVIGLTGLFFIDRKQLLKYILANLLIGLFFLPNISIMIQQMNYDGIDYLVKPTATYILDYLFYVFQYSLITVLLIVGIIVYSIINSKVSYNKYTLIAFSWFALIFIIGFIYSVLVRPVMPYRSLLFSLPFMLIFIFSFSQKIKPKLIVLFCSGILFVNVFTLVNQRDHYNLFKKGIAKSVVSKTNNVIKSGGNPFVIYNTADFNIKFYQEKFNCNFDYYNMHNNVPSPIEFKETIYKIADDEVIAFNLPENLMSILYEHYPFVLEKDFGFCHNYYRLSNIKDNQAKSWIKKDTYQFEEEADSIFVSHLKKDSISNNQYYQFNNDEEWGPTLSFPLGKEIPNSFVIVEASVSVKRLSDSHGLLILEIVDGENSLAWRSTETKNWMEKKDEWENVYFSVQLNELIKENQLKENLELRVYFWNQDKKEIAIDNLSIKVSKGNHLIYSLLEDFPKLSSE